MCQAKTFFFFFFLFALSLRLSLSLRFTASIASHSYSFFIISYLLFYVKLSQRIFSFRVFGLVFAFDCILCNEYIFYEKISPFFLTLFFRLSSIVWSFRCISLPYLSPQKRRLENAFSSLKKFTIFNAHLFFFYLSTEVQSGSLTRVTAHFFRHIYSVSIHYTVLKYCEKNANLMSLSVWFVHFAQSMINVIIYYAFVATVYHWKLNKTKTSKQRQR